MPELLLLLLVASPGVPDVVVTLTIWRAAWAALVMQARASRASATLLCRLAAMQIKPDLEFACKRCWWMCRGWTPCLHVLTPPPGCRGPLSEVFI